MKLLPSVTSSTAQTGIAPRGLIVALLGTLDVKTLPTSRCGDASNLDKICCFSSKLWWSLPPHRAPKQQAALQEASCLHSRLQVRSGGKVKSAEMKILKKVLLCVIRKFETICCCLIVWRLSDRLSGWLLNFFFKFCFFTLFETSLKSQLFKNAILKMNYCK